MDEAVVGYDGANEVSYHLHEFRRHIEDANGPIAAALGTALAPDQVLAAASGVEALDDACAALQDVLANVLNQSDGLRLFAATRHASPGLWVRNPLDHGATRAIAELAIHRWCTWVDPGPGYELSDLTADDIGLVRLVLGAAEVYGLLLGTRRRVAKNQQVTVLGIAPLSCDVTDNTDGVADMIAIRDHRVRASNNLLAPLSGLLTDEFDDWNDDEHVHRIVASEYVPVEEFVPYYLPDPPERRHLLPSGSGLGFRIVDQFDRVCRAGCVAHLEQRTLHLSSLDDDLLARHGFGVADIDAALECLSTKVMVNGWFPRDFELHGFDIVDAPADDELALCAAKAVDPNGRTLTLQSVRAAMRYLDAGRHPIPLSQPLLQLPIRQIGDRILYDGAQLHTCPAILWEADPSTAVKQRIEKQFEALVHERLGKLGPQPYDSGKILKRRNGSEFTDVDACVRIGDQLVVVDCYGSPWRTTLDDGSHAQTRNRADALVKKVREWQAQWAELQATLPHLLPDGVTDVLPVVVTPGAEWIPSMDADLWLDESTPAFCTVDELVAYLIVAGGGRGPRQRPRD